MDRLKDRVAIVTGAASGIGRAIAQRFHDEGALVFAVDRNAETLGRLPPDSDRWATHLSDVSVRGATAPLIAACVARPGEKVISVSGAQVGLNFDNSHQNLNAANTAFNPYDGSSLGLTFTQPLLRGFGPAAVPACAVAQHRIVALVSAAVGQCVFVVLSCSLFAASGHADAAAHALSPVSRRRRSTCCSYAARNALPNSA